MMMMMMMMMMMTDDNYDKEIIIIIMSACPTLAKEQYTENENTACVHSNKHCHMKEAAKIRQGTLISGCTKISTNKSRR
jgi:hypothetical protein